METDEAIKRYHDALAANIRRLVAARGLSIVQLSDFSSTSKSHLYDVIARKETASLVWIIKIAVALGVTPADLLRE